MKTNFEAPRHHRRWHKPERPLAAVRICALLLVMTAVPARGADAANGERLAFQYHCMTCHGERGKSNAGRYPNLAGQHAAYLEARLNYFRNAEEPGNLMNAQSAHLEDAEIADLAAYFSGQPR